MHRVILLIVMMNCALAQAKGVGPRPVQGGIPPYDAILEDELILAVNATLRESAEILKAIAEADDETWFVPPTRTRKPTGSRDVEVRYSRKMVEQAVYEHEYETIEVMRPVRKGSSTDGVTVYQKVKHRRVVSRKQVGTRKVERLVRDPEGSETRTHKVPLYGPGGPDVWARHALGHNALCGFALLRAGVPEDDEVLSGFIRSMDSFIAAYGVPDHTWDVAWLTAFYANLSSPAHHKTAQRLCQRLLDGQLTVGNARGMWGPVSVNMSALAESIPKVQRLAEAKLAADKEAETGGPDAVQRSLQIDRDYAEAVTTLRGAAMLGRAGHTVESRYTVAPIQAHDTPIIMGGVPDYVYNQRSADIGNTALALFGIREAADHGLLPETESRRSSRNSKSHTAALARTASALAKAQAQNGAWDEMNSVQAAEVTGALRMFPGIPMSNPRFPSLESKETILSSAQGQSALRSIGEAIGVATLARKYGRNISAGTRYAAMQGDSLLATWPALELAGGDAPPYDAIFFLRDAVRDPFTGTCARPDLRARIAWALLDHWEPNLGWRHRHALRGSSPYMMATSLRARMDALPAPTKQTPTDLGAPHVNAGYYGIRQHEARGRRTVHHLLPTALSMLFLSDLTRPPVAASISWNAEAGGSRVLNSALRVLNKNHKVDLAAATHERPITLREASRLPSLVIRGSGAFDASPEEERALSTYLANGGLIVFEMPADSAGAAFLRGIKDRIRTLVPDGQTQNISSNKDFLGSAAGRGAVQGVVRADGSLAAVLLPVQLAAGRGGVPPALAAEIVHNLMLQKIDPDLLDPGYALSASTLDAKSAIAIALRGAPPPAAPAPAGDATLADDTDRPETPASAADSSETPLAEDETF